MASPRTRAEFAFTGRFDAQPKGVVFGARPRQPDRRARRPPGRLRAADGASPGDCRRLGPPPRPRRAGDLARGEGGRPLHARRVREVGPQWADLVRGACAVLEARGSRLPGIDLAIARPPGEEGPRLLGRLRRGGRPLPPRRRLPDGSPAGIARIAQEVEAKSAGVRCGAIDPYVAAMGKSAAPILLDCLHPTHEALPWPDGVEAVPVDTGVARDLAATAYNERRAELEAAIAVLKKARPGTQSLRDWSLDDLENLEDAIPAASRRRLRHALTEMTRVKRAADALRKGDAKALGAVLNEGHESLSSDFEPRARHRRAGRSAAHRAGRPRRPPSGRRLRRVPGRAAGEGPGGGAPRSPRGPARGRRVVSARGGSRTLNALAGTRVLRRRRVCQFRHSRARQGSYGPERRLSGTRPNPECTVERRADDHSRFTEYGSVREWRVLTERPPNRLPRLQTQPHEANPIANGNRPTRKFLPTNVIIEVLDHLPYILACFSFGRASMPKSPISTLPLSTSSTLKTFRPLSQDKLRDV